MHVETNCKTGRTGLTSAWKRQTNCCLNTLCCYTVFCLVMLSSLWPLWILIQGNFISRVSKIVHKHAPQFPSWQPAWEAGSSLHSPLTRSSGKICFQSGVKNNLKHGSSLNHCIWWIVSFINSYYLILLRPTLKPTLWT